MSKHQTQALPNILLKYQPTQTPPDVTRATYDWGQAVLIHSMFQDYVTQRRMTKKQAVEEMAAEIGVIPATVRTRLNRVARQLFREHPEERV